MRPILLLDSACTVGSWHVPGMVGVQWLLVAFTRIQTPKSIDLSVCAKGLLGSSPLGHDVSRF